MSTKPEQGIYVQATIEECFEGSEPLIKAKLTTYTGRKKIRVMFQGYPVSNFQQALSMFNSNEMYPGRLNSTFSFTKGIE